MEPKAELLVFNKKEVGVIVILLVLVALFSFTLGLKLGKTLGAAKAQSTEEAPLAAKKEVPAEPVHENAEQAAPAKEEAKAEAKGEEAAKEEEKKEGPSAAAEAEDHADALLATEASKEKVTAKKPVPMSLPKEKMGEGKEGARFTLQVGSYRTVAEAAEQVSALKRRNIDAFYLEAKVPGKGTWYRVGIGLFPSKERAEHIAAQWKVSKKLPPFIVQKVTE